MRETINDALVRLVTDLGGAKKVAAELWPEKPIEAAHRQLLDCLNEERPARLSPEHLLSLLRIGREKDVHIGMWFMAEALEYARPEPITREIDIQQAIRGYEETTDRLIDKLMTAQAEIKQLLAAQKRPPELRRAQV